MKGQDAARRRTRDGLGWDMNSNTTIGRRRGTKGANRLTGPATAAQFKLPGAKVPVIPPKWQWHYRTLADLRDQLMADARSKLHDAAQPIEVHSLHAADSATDEVDHDVALTLLTREESALRDVEDAMARIVNGTDGRCEETGARIPANRLRALPWCRYTREVEERFERKNGGLKCRLPGTTSIRGWRRDIPGTALAGRNADRAEKFP